MKEDRINIKPGNLVIAKKSLKMSATTTDLMSLSDEEFDDFFIEEFKKQKNHVFQTSICKSDALTFLKSKKHLWLYNGVDLITIYKYYFLNGNNIIYMSLDDRHSRNTFEDIFELVG
jgi:hypothetical protein